ncbi:hypothetical protein [Cohnella sp. AR92]|uniref:hypothetical protein n=1 Tax=Cohnella sp. AR92 TaxID=648716 RepID=UPI000F8DA13A|nr:hypothetical protein [Cohnella sp. AR92]RUS49116.1 hypothetical protein ELR57_01890 [Cohnella sp. AR92]
MEIVIYPDGPWSSYPFARLAMLLASVGTVHYVTERSDERLPAPILPVSRQEIREAGTPLLTIVSHPYWTYEASSLARGPLVALLPDFPNDRGALIRRCVKELSAAADLLCTASESFFLEQAFRRDAVLLLSGADPDAAGTVQVQGIDLEVRDYEALFLRAVRSLIDTSPPSAGWATHLQLHLRIPFYEELRRTLGPHETVSFLLGSYEYLTGRLDDAEAHVAEAFHQACLNRSPGSLASHFRFLSAIAARKGDLEGALTIYGISAVTDSERADYSVLLQWANQGRFALALSGLYRLNDDSRNALAQLRTPESDIEEVRRIEFQLLTESARWDEACSLLSPSMRQTSEQRRIADLANGFRCRLRGQRHEAISWFLRAAETDSNALAHILEIKAIDDELSGLTGSPALGLTEESEDDAPLEPRLPAGSQADGQQADRDAPGSE